MKHWREAAIVVGVLMLWASVGIVPKLGTVVNGLSNATDYVARSWPPDWSVLPSLRGPIIETLQMGVLGVTLGAMIATPLSFLAARETSPALPAYLLAKAIINVCRSIPTLLWAILFVTMVGLGPAAGVFALAVHCTGSLGKYFSESIESIYPRVREILEAMEVDGAGKSRAVFYGLLPAVAPLFLSYIAYYFEWSVRVGTILGLVGAGGLGLRLTMAIRMFRRQEVAAIVIAIVAMVTVIDGLSRLMRKRLLEDTI